MKNHESPPFKKEFKKEPLGTGGFAVVQEFKRDPRWVAKEIPEAAYGERAANTKKIYEIVKKSLGHFIPQTHFVIGKNNDGREVLFMVQEKIQGKNLLEFLPTLQKEHQQEKEALLQEVDRLLAGAVELYLHSYAQTPGRGISLDFRVDNIMIGKRDGESQNHAYYPDMYPLYELDPGDFIPGIRRYREKIQATLPFPMSRLQAALRKLGVLEKEHVRLFGKYEK